MPDVRFRLLTFGLDTTRDLYASVVFTPSVRGAIGPGGLHVGRVVVPFGEIDPTTGIGVARLAETTLLRPECHFIVSVEWAESAPQGWAEINWPIHVPLAGGWLEDLLPVPPSPVHTWTSLNPPPPGFVGFWLHSIPGDPDPGTPTGTGELRPVF